MPRVSAGDLPHEVDDARGGDEDKGELGAWDHKNLAIEHAKELAKAAPLGQVIVHGEDGKIQDEFTYGEDPRNIPG